MADIALEQLLHTAGDNTLGTTDGALHSYMRGTDGTTTRTVKTDANGNIIISPDSGLGTETTLAALATLLTSLDGKVATDAKLEAARLLLASLNGKDYATQAKQDAAKVVLDAISTAVAARATEATLAQIKTALTDGTLKAQLSGSIAESGANRQLYVADTLPVMPLVTPTYDGSGQGVHPHVLYYPGGRFGHKFWMAFTPYTNGDNKTENPSILVSEDGVTWAVPDGLVNPVVAYPGAGKYNSDPYLVDDGTKLYLYYRRTTTGVSSTLYRIETTDGITWSGATPLTLDIASAEAFVSPCIRRVRSNDWRMYLVDKACVWKYTSTDGVTWARQIGVLPRMRVWHAFVTHDGAGYHMLAALMDESGSSNATQLHYGFGLNEYSIQMDPVPLLYPGQAGAWTDAQVYNASMVIVDGVPWLYFSARSGTTWRIGRVRAARGNIADQSGERDYVFATGSDVPIASGTSKSWDIMRIVGGEMAIAIRMSAKVKWKLELEQMNPLDTTALHSKTIIDHSATAAEWDSVTVAVPHRTLRLKLTNLEGADIAVRSLFVTTRP